MKYPMAAAPKAAKTAVVRATPSKVRVGAKNRPATEANTVPMIQAQRRARAGSSPLIDTSSGLSTTPRMTTPSRTDRKNQYRTPDAITEMTNRITCSQVTLTPRILTVDCERKWGNVGGLLPNHSWASESTMRINPTVDTTLIVSEAPLSDRAKSSSPRPRSGATTPRQMTAAAGHGTPCSLWR